MWWLTIGVCILSFLTSPVKTFGEVRPSHPETTASPSTQAVSPKQFQAVLDRQLRQQFPVKDVKFSVNILFPTQPILVPTGRLGIQVSPDTMNGQTGRRAFRGLIHVNGKFEQMVNLVAEIEAHTPVAVPVRLIQAHEILQPGDIHMIDVALPALHHEYLQQMNMVVGKKAMRLLPPNLPIQRSYVTEAPLIHKGDRVVIEARRGGLLVQTVGIAKDSGEAGKTITVQNQTSGREVIGKVVNAGLVEVVF